MPAGDPSDWLSGDTPEARAIRMLVEESDLSPNQARELVERHGVDRETLLRIAATRKAEG